MTYKLEPGFGRIMSHILLRFPDGHTAFFSSGEEVCEMTFDRNYRVTEIRAVGDRIEIRVEEMAVPEINAVGEETFF